MRQRHCFSFWLLWKGRESSELQVQKPAAPPVSVNHDLCDPEQVISTLQALVFIPGKSRGGREQQLSNFYKSGIAFSLEIFYGNAEYKTDFKNWAALVEEGGVETPLACP